MDVLKDFELRQVGSRLVLRQICPPDFEMRTVIAADKIVEQKEDFFVLGYNEKFFCLCRYDKQNRCLCSKIGCDDYVRLGKKILFLQNMMWQLWDEDFQLHFLGEAVDQKKRYLSVNFSKAKHGTGFICSAILRETGCVKSGAAIIRRLKGKAFPVCKLILPNLKLKVFGVFSISFREENGAIVRG